MTQHVTIPRDPWPFTGHRSLAEIWDVAPERDTDTPRGEPQQSEAAE